MSTYPKVHSRSLINLGFADAIHGGFSRRPLLPNPEETSHFLQQYADREEQQVPMTIEAAFATTDHYRVNSPIQILNGLTHAFSFQHTCSKSSSKKKEKHQKCKI